MKVSVELEEGIKYVILFHVCLSTNLGPSNTVFSFRLEQNNRSSYYGIEILFCVFISAAGLVLACYQILSKLMELL